MDDYAEEKCQRYTYYEIQLSAPGMNLYGASQIGFPVLRFAYSDYVGFTQTLTEFWIRAIRAHLDEHGADLDSLGTLVPLPTGLWRASNSIDLSKDVVARREYVEPTRAGL